MISDELSVVVSRVNMPDSVVNRFLDLNQLAMGMVGAEIEFAEEPDDQQVFGLGLAINHALRRIDTTGIILKTDVDNVWPLATLEAVKRECRPGRPVFVMMADVDPGQPLPAHWDPAKVRAEAYGNVAMYAQDWYRLCGYDERIVGWGGDDTNLLQRARDILRPQVRSDLPLWHLSHPSRKTSPAWFHNGQLNIAMASRSRWQEPRFGNADLAGVTAIVKTFDRPACCQRLLNSIRRYYPDLKIIVADDSTTPRDWRAPGVASLPMAFDSGEGFARNVMAESVATPYLLFLDDDFIFTPQTDLHALLWALNANSLDICAGAVLHHQDGQPARYNGCFLWQGSMLHLIEPANIGQGGPVDVAVNFYLARTASVRGLWDSSLKINGHLDSFLTAKERGLWVAYHPACSLHHAPESPADYQVYRDRGELEFRCQWMAKHGMTEINEFGRVTTF
jgi:hypothetical protein